ncbi:MAG TPA: hypothetical protein VK961_01660 [Chthoniobacter sp.]|nr:hypothetical protein [Chthoniobacter sp.]
MKQLIHINLTTKSTDWQPPVLTFGESLTLALRFTKTINGNDVDPNLSLSSAKATIGLVDTPPGGGKFALQFGADPGTPANTTAELSHDCAPAQLAAAINALSSIVATYGTVTAKKVNGSWLLRFGNGAAEVPFKVVDNSLWPVSFGRVMARQFDNAWLHELRFVQAPAAFVSATGGLTLPDPPSISVIKSGGASGDYVWDTIQQLSIPPDFRGSYRIKKGFQRTALLAPDAGTDEIQAALIAAFGNTFIVTLPFSYHFYIDLGGDYAGLDVPPMEVEAAEAPQGDLVLTIPLDRAELASLLRASTSVTLPLEIRIVAMEDGGAPQEIVALYTPVTIQRPLAFPELEEQPTIDWLRFPSPTTYLSVGSGAMLTGEKIKAVTVGDASHTSFAITHLFASSDVQVFVKENGGARRQLVDGTDFTATIDTDSQVTVTALTGAPALDAWRIMIVAAKEITSWVDGLVLGMDHITGLEDALAGFDARIHALENLLPGNASLPAGLTPADHFIIQIPEASEILFARDTSGVPITDPAKLPARAPYLLPAIDTVSTPSTLADPLPAPSTGTLYATAAATLIPGGGHVRSSIAPFPGFVGSDGRMLYPVTRSGTKNSYFPTPFERTLFEVAINDVMFSSGTVLTCLFKLALQLINANTEAQWMLAIEQAPIVGETSGDPDTFDANLYSVDWATATPLLLQRLIMTSALETHGFGVTIARTGDTTFTANALKYKRVFNANAGVPATANFALRARLFNFDTKNSATDARGWVSWALQAPDNGPLGIVIT